ncbi:MAG: glycerol-3-phosphate dehydrogenase/oxidase [Desulfobacteraceae bacterium]|nr:MAG: glycerol-3-phosphate dehydrogenase/oxidase [Desulfobacteraceae bacterium]
MTERNVHGLAEWDLLVIGGGITGAGILREAARRGLAACLIEQRDFAWGTSGRSSNMVHGGLRYLMAGRFNLTRDSLLERERLLHEAPGLVDPLGFLFSDYKGRCPGRWSFSVLLTVYDLLARRWNHRHYPPHEFTMLAPRIMLTGLKGGAQCFDAVTDDARLVCRVIQEAKQEGAVALNYVAADQLMIERNRVCGAALRDVLTGATAEVRAKALVNATGAWADRFRKRVGGGHDIRPLRGSHLVFPFWRLPVSQAIGMKHPVDRRSVFLLPWEGMTVVGSTDLDHDENLDIEASITPEEVEYLLEIVHCQFPALAIDRSDIVSTYAGVRPVIGTGALNPSSERREHSIWVERGLISVSGGKLTTFRLIALDVLKRAAQFIPSLTVEDTGEPVFSKVSELEPSFQELDRALRERLVGRYGIAAGKVAQCARDGELTRIPGTNTLWVELRWGARTEAVVHLEDLLLRRTRLGVVVARGGAAFFDRIKLICQEELGWDENRWQDEVHAYRNLWQRCYSVPGRNQ